MDGLVGTKFFAVIEPYIKIEPYEREGGVSNPRDRIEIWSWIPPEVKRQALEHEQPCVACGAPNHPFREREKSGHLYYAATCPWSVTLRCSRGRAAREEYLRVRAAVGRHPRKPQGDLFQ